MEDTICEICLSLNNPSKVKFTFHPPGVDKINYQSKAGVSSND